MTRIFVERRELPEDLQALLDVIWNDGARDAAIPAECTPPLDVLETESGVEVVMDLPGIAASTLQIVFSRNVLIVAGQKLPAREHPDAAFHLAERAFGRFARAVRLEGAYDAGRADASLAAGELRVLLPRIDERRGREIRIPVR
ncbi:MAG TPA: Hsp20/alpha crystallin family protein [Vicinamibacterales bacterium]|jgi:HSP20 family protein|nr:Hsp20/alpha crystallin family protein [Vicinamibacterales bacterium]